METTSLDTLNPRTASAQSNSTTTLAWLIMVLASMLPDVILNEVVHLQVSWLYYAKFGILLLAAASTFFFTSARPLRNFTFILLGLYLVEELVARFTAAPFWKAHFATFQAPFSVTMAGEQIGRLIAAFLMIAILLVMGYNRKDIFLSPGKLNARMQPVRWLGFPKADPWTNFGGQFAVYISLGLFAFLMIGGHPSLAAFQRIIPILPIILGLALMNAFSEEMTFRAALIAGLENSIGSRQAVYVAAAFFGLAHFYGVPYGILGVAMSSFLGWLLGKAMVETRGMFWSLLIHFLQDVLVFSFLAMGSITPGG